MFSNRSSWMVYAGAALFLASCGGGGSSGGGEDSPVPAPGPSLQQRIDAATNTSATNSICNTLTPYYWEIGDKSGVLASGAGGDNSTTAPNSSTTMFIASASKWLFGAYALQQTPYEQIKSAGNIKYLNFTSGYDNMGTLACVLQGSVAGCFGASSSNGGLNSDFHAADVGRFYYNAGHLQAYANNIVGLGGYYDNPAPGTPKLADEVMAKIGQDIAIEYSNPAPAGGIKTSAANYAVFLRKILSGSLAIANHLGADKVCAWTGASDCDALSSPINGTNNVISNEKWHYSIAHWVEDDPSVGDGAYSSAGLYGFYPWIDSSKTYYGMVARYDSNIAPADPKLAPYNTSVNCGRLLRKAWLSGSVQ